MINLLPEQAKKDILAAKRNVVLRNFLLLLGLTALVIASAFGYIWFTISQEKAAAERITRANIAASAEFNDVRTKANQFSDNVLQSKSIINAGINFNQLILDIAKYVPRGVVLSNLSFNTTSFKSAITLSARATTNDTGVDLKNRLEASPTFKNVRIISLVKGESEDDNLAARYPIVVDITAEFEALP